MTQPSISTQTVESNVRARVRTESQTGSGIRGDCSIDLTYESAKVSIEFGAETAPTLSIGQWVTLEFASSPGSEPIEARAKAMSWRSTGALETYTFAVERDESQPLAALVSRRVEERVRVDQLNPVRASLLDDSGRCREGLLHDLSLGGCALLFQAEEPWMLSHDRRTTVQLDLFPGEPMLSIQGYLRSRRLSGLEVLFGFAFEPSQVESEEVYDRLQRFLELRAQEIELLKL